MQKSKSVTGGLPQDVNNPANTPMVTRNDDRSIGDLFKDLAEDMGRLMRQELELARVETVEKVSKASRSLILMVAGGLVAYAGLIFLLLGIAFALGDVMPLWLAALIVALVVVVVGAILISSGRSTLSSLSMVPERTVESIKEDAQWAKEKLP